MQDHLLDLLSATLQKGASYFWKNKKHNEMLQDPDYRPGSVKNITVPLNVVEEVRKSEDYITLSGQLQAEIDRVQTELTPFAMRAHDLNRKAFLIRWRNSYYALLVSASRVFIAKHHLGGHYTEHVAVIDLLVRFPDEVTSMLNSTVEDFLRGFREHQELAALLQPTESNHDLAAVIARINAPPPPAPAPANNPPAAADAAAVPPTGAPAPAADAASVATAPAALASSATMTSGARPEVVAAVHRALAEHAPHLLTPSGRASLANSFTTATGAPVVPPSSARSTNRTNQAINSINQPSTAAPAASAPANNEDATMTGSDDDLALTAGRGAVTHDLYGLLKHGVLEPRDAFLLAVQTSEQTKRIKKASKPVHLDETAARIAAVVEAERPVNHSTLVGVIRHEQSKDSRVDDLQREIQSLKAKLGVKSSAPAKAATNSTKVPKNKNGGGKNNTHGQAAANKQTKSRPSHAAKGAAGASKGTAAAAKNKQQNRSSKPSGKKKPSLPTKKRN
jgi:hypothetical protein